MPATATIIKAFTTLKPREEWSFRDAGRSQTTAFTHDYHRYPAKFIPQIVRKLIEDYAPSGTQVVCDPFGGCGTTLVEAKMLGHKSIGFDINPVAKLITQTKTTAIKPKTLANTRNKFLKYYENAPSVSYNHHQRINYWFDEPTIQELDKIYFAIKKIKNHNVRRFFLCSFSHNLKNCSRWLMKSIKPTIDKEKTVPNPKESFLRHLDSMIKKNGQFYSTLAQSGYTNVSTKMYRRDSTKKFPIEQEMIDLVITSPPYVTSYEYADLHQLTLLWFGGDPKHFKKWHHFSNEFIDFRRNFIGTSSKNEKSGEFNSVIAEKIIDDLMQVERPLAVDVANYFLDMKKVFAEIHRVLKTGGKACIIIGNTSLRGVEILNAQVAAEQMQAAGFRKPVFIKREIPNKMITPYRDLESGKFTGKDNPSKVRAYEYEYVVVMDKV
ncbi:MAG: methylase N-4/N-6 domain protein [Parcubacteria group bacterium GW2011_GWC1_45_13]|uniref:site-specific DNA-methyltransferase (cytosine-N(4)-specific) n=3 Tax=Patescibacteria group TaxID=1783273 RepID=A0A0G1IYS5_9BACT|nr:MAG: methylase N-4/N-6 domain protein [Candidatus Giovannonibacteria bacterium GW2011_GWB1_44_23]KKT64128.1 MAG: methylase N-4/N-6 domain protein [Candidatus Giovannonibacteria bacterium GW2011_GWA1_44_29]KKT91728.1 MAG: methylase N-4/N-6 domain protein [Parcubacteria group bacterium GW2011_GWC1_45_13]KKU82546.1 MAG: methylase N-4/N-6 domain protein [Candidatus Amesbacteria bacterium GW2011_GWC2_47_8]